MSRKKKQLENEIYLGKFQLGWVMCDVYALPYETGGQIQACPSMNSSAKMRIGLKYDEWRHVFAVMQHEAFEYCMCDAGCSYSRRDAWVPDATDTPVFMFNHNQFTEIAARSSYFLLSAHDALREAWEKAKSIREG